MPSILSTARIARLLQKQKDRANRLRTTWFAGTTHIQDVINAAVEIKLQLHFEHDNFQKAVEELAKSRRPSSR